MNKHTHCEHTPGAVGSQCCGTRGAVGGSVPCSRVSPQLYPIKSLLLSHHHSTCALVSEILESVLQTVQKQFTYRQYHYILTDDNVQYTHKYTQYTQCTIRHTYSYQYTLHTPYVHILHYVHIYTHNNMQRCSRLYISWIRKCHGCALDSIQW